MISHIIKNQTKLYQVHFQLIAIDYSVESATDVDQYC